MVDHGLRRYSSDPLLDAIIIAPPKYAVYGNITQLAVNLTLLDSRKYGFVDAFVNNSI